LCKGLRWCCNLVVLGLLARRMWLLLLVGAWKIRTRRRLQMRKVWLGLLRQKQLLGFWFRRGSGSCRVKGRQIRTLRRISALTRHG